MGLAIASNIASLNSQRYLSSNTAKLGKVFERLSSGLRINSPSDDPAGLSLADSLRAQTTLASVAIRNANDGLSITAIADAALEEVGTILERMAELATQSSNGVYDNTQRSALASEFIALGSEIERIAATTQFNNISLLSNSSSITLQVGITGGANSQITINNVTSTLNALGLAGSGSSALSYSLTGTSTAFAQTASQNALNAINSAISSLSAIRGTIGAAESRLTSAVDYITMARENYAAAESRIRDADVAQEVAELVRLQTIQQSNIAVLAQANLQPQLVLKLLQ